MRVIELVDAPGVPPETVVEEIRPGYVWRGQVVRYAEVRAHAPRRSIGGEDEEPADDMEPAEDADRDDPFDRNEAVDEEEPWQGKDARYGNDRRD